MDNINMEFNEFINERVEEKLNQNKVYKNENLSFEELKEKIYNILSKEDTVTFNDFIFTIFSMKSKEFYTAYKIGFYDGIKFSNDMQ